MTIHRIGGLTVVAAMAAAAGGCGTGSYVYQPTEQSNATLEGRPAARYGIPPERPTGDVRVISSGVNDVEPAPGSPHIKVLQARMVVANNLDNTPWIVDTRAQYAWIAGEGKARPMFANSDAPGAPLLRIGRGEQRTVDLYYPLPQGMQSEDKLPTFDLAWQVQTGQRLIAERTPFERIPIEPLYAPSYAAYGVGLGWGPYWWYDPFWPHVTYVHPVYIGPHFGVVHPHVYMGSGHLWVARPHAWRYR
jgi:hypothetical protein